VSGKLTALASLALDNVVAHALGYAASCAGLLLTLALWIAGTAVAEGLRAEGLRAADAGADIVVSLRALGRHAPIDASIAEQLRAINGVERVEGRVSGVVDVNGTPLLIIGVEPQRLASASELERGAAPKVSGECLVGAEIAHELGLYPGAHLALEGGAMTRVVSISGVLRADDALAGSKTLIMDLAESQTLFGDTRLTQMCLWTRAGYADAVARAVERMDGRLVATTRETTRAAIEHAANRRSGGLSALLAPLLALATVSFATLSWFAHARRASEIAAYKLFGFSGGDTLFVTVIENALVALALGTTAFLGAWIFVRGFDAPLLAAWLIPDLDLFPTQRIPAAFTPLPLGLGLALALCTTLAGSILATWRLSLASTTKAFA